MPLQSWEKVSRNDSGYKACLAVAGGAGAVLGGLTGSVLGPAGTLAGYGGGSIWGLAIGYLACPYLVPAIKSKIERGMSLSDAEIRSAAEAMSQYAQVHQAADAVKLVGLVKTNWSAIPAGTKACVNPAIAAKQILA